MADKDARKKVTVIADVQSKTIFKGPSWKSIEGALEGMRSQIDKHDIEDLLQKDFREVREKQRIDFIVTPDMAPRLKAALSDLLKAHGVKPSKY